MATLLLNGTQLEPQAPSVPLNKPFLLSIAVIYLIAMHVFVPNVGGEGLMLPFNVTTWLFLSIPIALGLYQLGTNQYMRYSKLTIGLWLCCVLMTLPMLYSQADWGSSIDRVLGLWSGFALFLLLQQFHFSNKSKQKLLWFIVLATLIEAFIGIFQYILKTPGSFFEPSRIPYGIFQQADTMTSFLATGVVLSGYLLARQPKVYNKKLREVGLLYLTPLINLPLIVLLDSFTGWVTSGIAVLLLLPYLYKFSPKQRFLNWAVASFTGLIIGLGAQYFQAEHDFKIDQQVVSSSFRTTIPQAVDMLIEKPFTGYGYGRFESKYVLYTARQHQLNSKYLPAIPSTQHPDNEILYWGVEGGGLPVLGQLLAVIFVLIRIRSAKPDTRLAMFALLLPITIQGQFGTPFYQSAIHWLTFVILLFWVEQRVAKYHLFRFSNVSRSILRISTIILPVIITFYMASVLHTNFLLSQFEKSASSNINLLHKIVNPDVAKERLDHDIYTTYLKVGLRDNKQEYFQPYIDWSLNMIQQKPRPEFYINLIKAYQAIGDSSRSEQVRAEAEFLFPKLDFSLSSTNEDTTKNMDGDSKTTRL